MPPGEGGSTPGNIVDGGVPRRPRRGLFTRWTEKMSPGNLAFDRHVAEFEARQEELQARQEEQAEQLLQNQMTASSLLGTMSFRVCYPYLNILSENRVDEESTLNDTDSTSPPPLPKDDSTQQGEERFLKDSAKPPDDTDFLEGTSFKINSDKQKATTGNKKSRKKQKKKKGKGKGRKQSHASEMQSETHTEPSSTCAAETSGKTLASPSSRVAVHVPLLEYSSSSSSSRVTANLIITPVANSASSGNEKTLSASSSNDDFKSFKSTTSYATAASSSVNDYYTGDNHARNSTMGDYVGSMSDARSERSASDSTHSRGFKKISGEGNRPHVHQSFSLVIGPGRRQESSLCSDDSRNDGDFQKVVSRKSAQKMKKMQRLESPTPSSAMAASGSGPVITRKLVPRAPFREVITIGHYINDDTFYGRKPNQKKGKYQKASSLSNQSKIGSTDGDNVSGSNRMLLIRTVHQAKPRSSHHVTLEDIEETNNSPSCNPKEGELKAKATVGDGIKKADSKAPYNYPSCNPNEGELKAKATVGDGIIKADSKAPFSDKPSSLGHLDNSSCEDEKKKAMALVGGDSKHTSDSRAATSDLTLSLCHLPISSCADSEEQMKEESRISFSSHAPSDLDKITKAANNAYEIQAASDVYMISGIHADIENFLHAATPIVGQISCTKSNISLQDQQLWSVWSWYEESECCGIEVQMQGKINSIWPEFSTYFKPLLSAVQLFGHPGKSLVFEYFESENPFSRPPIFTKIKQLRDGENLTKKNAMFGDPKKLESVKLSELHPASWYCVAWYPICQIPTAPGRCQASFLTYHSLGKLVPQTCSMDKAGHDRIICPIVGLLGYKDQGENWFQLREQLRFKQTPNVSWETDHAELLNKRLRTLRQGASIISKAVVPKASGQAMNSHSDYAFFWSRFL